MPVRRVILFSLLLTIAFWVIALWPAPRFLFTGIPNGAQAEKYGGREMAPGDPLQLLYHFNLARQVLAGHVTLFHDIYEFNTGDDKACHAFDSYYIPFSFIHALAAPVSEAFGYQLAGFFSLWMSCLFMWLLIRRFVGNDLLAAIAALAGLAFPFRITTFLMGSPTGFGICWVPLLLYGLDCAIRDDSWKGGLVAGLAIFAAAMGDLHVFYFCSIAMPAWAILAWFVRDKFEWQSPVAWRRLIVALLPFLFFLALAGIYAWRFNQTIGDSGMAQGRTLGEIRKFSPAWIGFFDPGATGVNSHVYLGYTLIATVFYSWMFALGRYRHLASSERRAFRILTLLIIAGVAIAILALGPRGPWSGKLFSLCRKTIPMYTMIRQPAKIFALMPTLAALALALAMVLLWIRIQSRPLRRFVFCALGLAIVFEYGRNISPSFCVLKPDQQAYQAAADDSANDFHIPRALVVPLWPGDSHFSSVYLYYAMHAGVRMMNGYAPKIRRNYFEDVFKRYESINSGWLDDAQAQSLLAAGVRYIILHENLFPEKVSPFSSAFTLHQFLNHPRLRLLLQDESVWTFKLLEQPEQREARAADWNIFFPSLRKELQPVRSNATRQSYAGDWNPPEPGASVSFPAALFFHPLAGSTDIASGGINLRCSRDAEGVALYGPRLPFEPGRYRVFIAIETTAPAGTILGRVRVQWDEDEDRPWTDLVAGQPLSLDFVQDKNLPINFAFAYTREADLRIDRIAFVRLP